MKKNSALKKQPPLYRRKAPKRRDAPARGTPPRHAGTEPGGFLLCEDPPASRPGRPLRSLELFAGAGGLALAASNAGFQHEAVLEYNHDACETIRANQRRGFEPVRHWPLIQGDVHHQDFRAWRGRVDLVSGGPPCQPFSIGGKRRAMADRRNLFPEAARVVREIRPRAFVFENVKGLTRQSFAKYFNHIVLQLNYPDISRRPGEEWAEHLARLERVRTEGVEPDLHYRVVWRLLNAADHGVAQKRERVFFVGFRSDIQIPWSFPGPTHSREALLSSQWVTGDYWERHGLARRNRPAAPPPFASRSGQELLFQPRTGRSPWRTVRDAISDLGEPTKSGDGVRCPNHVLQAGARSYAGHTGSPLDEPAKTLKAGDHGVPGGENMLRHPGGEVVLRSVRVALERHEAGQTARLL